MGKKGRQRNRGKQARGRIAWLKEPRIFTSIAAIIVATVTAMSPVLTEYVKRSKPRVRKDVLSSPLPKQVPTPEPTLTRNAVDVTAKSNSAAVHLTFEQLTISGKEEGPWEFSGAPVVSVIVEGDQPLGSVKIGARFGQKAVYPDGDQLPCVSQNWLKIDFGADPHKRAVVVFNTSPIVWNLQLAAPWGHYYGYFEVTDSTGKTHKSEQFDFKCVYKPQLGSFNNLFKVVGDCFTFVARLGAVEVRQAPGTLGYVPATLKPTIPATRSMIIRGRFSVEEMDESAPPGLDVALVDTRGERVTTVFPDGRLDWYSVKIIGDKVSGDCEKSRVTGERLSAGVKYWFEIHVTIPERGMGLYALFISQQRTDLAKSCVHERYFESSDLQFDRMSLNLKLWRGGLIRLYDLQLVGE